MEPTQSSQTTHISADIEYLKVSVDDWTLIKVKWTATYIERRTLFKKLKTFKIFEQFPCLTQPNMKNLVRTSTIMIKYI